MTVIAPEYADDSTDRELVDQLLKCGEQLPDGLRDELMKVGESGVQALIAIVEDARGLSRSDSPEHGWAPIHAAEVLGERGEEAAVDALVDAVVGFHPEAIIYSKAVFALQNIGEPAREPILERIEQGVGPYGRDGLADVLATLEGRDERVHEVLMEVLEAEPALGAMYLADYGDPAAVEALRDKFHQLEVETDGSAVANQDFIELAEAIDQLGGTLTDQEEEKLERARRERADSLPSAVDEDDVIDFPDRGVEQGEPVGEPDEPFELTDEEREEANKQLARKRRRLRGGTKRKMKKAAKYARYRVEECRINPDWREDQFAVLAQLRATPGEGYAMANVFVDLGCLGPKDAMFETGVDRQEFDEFIEGFGMRFVDCDPHLATKILREGTLLGLHLGFSIPDEVYPILQLFDRFDPAKAEEDVPLGREGKPLYIAGPNDDIDAIMEHLAEQVGEDGFHYFIPYG